MWRQVSGVCPVQTWEEVPSVPSSPWTGHTAASPQGKHPMSANSSNFCSLLWPPRTLFCDKCTLSSTISISYSLGQWRQLPASRTDSRGQEITTWEQEEGAWPWVLHTRCLHDLHYPGNNQLILARHTPVEYGGQQSWEEQVSHNNWGNRGKCKQSSKPCQQCECKGQCGTVQDLSHPLQHHP